MKKYFAIVTLIFAAFLLVGCKQNKYDDFYIVVFYTDSNKSNVRVPTREVPKDTKITEPTLDLEDKPVVFEGWFKDAKYQTVFDFTTEVIKESTTIYAKWRYPEYKINYILADGEINHYRNELTFIPAQSGELGLRVRDPQKDGYRFRGWYLNAPYPESKHKIEYITLDLYDDGAEEIFLYPHWEKLN